MLTKRWENTSYWLQCSCRHTTLRRATMDQTIGSRRSSRIKKTRCEKTFSCYSFLSVLLEFRKFEEIVLLCLPNHCSDDFSPIVLSADSSMSTGNFSSIVFWADSLFHLSLTFFCYLWLVFEMRLVFAITCRPMREYAKTSLVFIASIFLLSCSIIFESQKFERVLRYCLLCIPSEY